MPLKGRRVHNHDIRFAFIGHNDRTSRFVNLLYNGKRFRLELSHRSNVFG